MTEKTVCWFREKLWKKDPGLQPHQRTADCSPEINLILWNNNSELLWRFGFSVFFFHPNILSSPTSFLKTLVGLLTFSLWAQLSVKNKKAILGLKSCFYFIGLRQWEKRECSLLNDFILICDHFLPYVSCECETPNGLRGRARLMVYLC